MYTFLNMIYSYTLIIYINILLFKNKSIRLYLCIVKLQWNVAIYIAFVSKIKLSFEWTDATILQNINIAIILIVRWNCIYQLYQYILYFLKNIINILYVYITCLNAVNCELTKMQLYTINNINYKKILLQFHCIFTSHMGQKARQVYLYSTFHTQW